MIHLQLLPHEIRANAARELGAAGNDAQRRRQSARTWAHIAALRADIEKRKEANNVD